MYSAVYVISIFLYMAITRDFERFHYKFLKDEILFRTTEAIFLVKHPKRKNKIFPYKTALSKVNFNTNSIGSTEWIYHKEWSFVTS